MPGQQTKSGNRTSAQSPRVLPLLCTPVTPSLDRARQALLAELFRGKIPCLRWKYWLGCGHGTKLHLTKSKGALNIMKFLAPARIVTRTRSEKLLREYDKVAHFREQVFSPPLPFLGFACAAKKPCA